MKNIPAKTSAKRLLLRKRFLRKKEFFPIFSNFSKSFSKHYFADSIFPFLNQDNIKEAVPFSVISISSITTTRYLAQRKLWLSR
jgi:hypothetical protein